MGIPESYPTPFKVRFESINYISIKYEFGLKYVFYYKYVGPV